MLAFGAETALFRKQARNILGKRMKKKESATQLLQDLYFNFPD